MRERGRAIDVEGFSDFILLMWTVSCSSIYGTLIWMMLGWMLCRFALSWNIVSLSFTSASVAVQTRVIWELKQRGKVRLTNYSYNIAGTSMWSVFSGLFDLFVFVLQYKIKISIREAPWYMPLTTSCTAGLDSQYKHTKHWFPNEQEGLQQFRGNHWKALGEENPDLLGIFFSDHFLTS